MEGKTHHRTITFSDEMFGGLGAQAKRHHRPFKMHVEYLIELAFKVIEEQDQMQAQEKAVSAKPHHSIWTDPFHPVGYGTMEPSLIPCGKLDAPST